MNECAAPSEVTPGSIICPVCHRPNPPDAVFCGSPACHKALGEFRYALEEVRAATPWTQRVADAVTAFVGKPHFITFHIAWFVLWIVINTGLIAMSAVFDEYPYGLLGIILSIEASLITSFLLISNNRQNAYADKRAELDYEVNVRTYRKLDQLSEGLDQLLIRIDDLEKKFAGKQP